MLTVIVLGTGKFINFFIYNRKVYLPVLGCHKDSEFATFSTLSSIGTLKRPKSV